MKSTKVHVYIPASLRKLCAGTRQIEIAATNVRDAIHALDAEFPGIADRLISGDSLQPEIVVVVDSEIREGGLLEPLTDGCELHFVSAVSGG